MERNMLAAKLCSLGFLFCNVWPEAFKSMIGFYVRWMVLCLHNVCGIGFTSVLGLTAGFRHGLLTLGLKMRTRRSHADSDRLNCLI